MSIRKLGAMAVALLLALLGITAYSQAQPVDSPAARVECPAKEHPDFITLELWGTQYTRDAEGNLQKDLPKETIKYGVFKVYQDRSEQLWINPRYEANKDQFEVVNYPSTVDEWNFTFSVPKYELAGPTWRITKSSTASRKFPHRGTAAIRIRIRMAPSDSPIPWLRMSRQRRPGRTTITPSKPARRTSLSCCWVTARKSLARLLVRPKIGRSPSLKWTSAQAATSSITRLWRSL